MRRYLLIFLLLSQLDGLIAQDGMLDTSFGIDGIVQTDIIDASRDVANAVVVQADNKIIVAGYTTDVANYMCLTRYHEDGSIDTSFGTNGKAITYFLANTQSITKDIALQEDGKIVVCGYANQGFAMVRFNADGSVDDSFGEMGLVTTDVLTNTSSANSIVIQQDGKIVLGGEVRNFPPDGFAFALVRYHEDGSLDTSFGTDGITITDIAEGSGLGALDFLNDLALQADGKIVAAGLSGPHCALVRYHSNGDLDTDFGENGIVIKNFSITGNSGFQSLAIQQSGEIVAVGFSTEGNSDFLVARYTSTGTPDPTFGTEGSVISMISPVQDGASSLLLTTDHKIIVGGASRHDDVHNFTLVRYTNEGSIDSTFGEQGVVVTLIADDHSVIASMAYQADGKIVATGSNVFSSDADFLLARYNLAQLTSAKNPLSQSSILIYPNPVRDEATIEYYINDASNIFIELFDVNGLFVKMIANDVYRTMGINTETIQMDELVNGVYFLSISSADKNEFFRVVKN